MNEIWWYLSRSSGIVAMVLIVAALVWGFFFSARATGTKRRPKWWLDLHNYLGGLAFAFVIIHREQWPPTRRKVANETILHGLPLRAAAKQLDLSLHTVRRHADAIRVMYEALGR